MYAVVFDVMPIPLGNSPDLRHYLLVLRNGRASMRNIDSETTTTLERIISQGNNSAIRVAYGSINYPLNIHDYSLVLARRHGGRPKSPSRGRAEVIFEGSARDQAIHMMREQGFTRE